MDFVPSQAVDFPMFWSIPTSGYCMNSLDRVAMALAHTVAHLMVFGPIVHIEYRYVEYGSLRSEEEKLETNFLSLKILEQGDLVIADGYTGIGEVVILCRVPQFVPEQSYRVLEVN
jgi:hypothetical protein